MAQAEHKKCSIEIALRFLPKYLDSRGKLLEHRSEVLLVHNFQDLNMYVKAILDSDPDSTNNKDHIKKITAIRGKMVALHNQGDPQKKQFQQWIVAIEVKFAIELSEHTKGWGEARKAAILTYTPPTQFRWHIPVTLLVIALTGYPAYLVVEHKPWQSITALKHSVTESVIVLLSLVLLSCIAYDKCQDQSSEAPAKARYEESVEEISL